MVSTRNGEHAKAIFTGDSKNDALAAHKEDCQCSDRLDETQVIARYRRKVREALEIQRLKTGPNEERGLNKDNGDYVTTSTWNSLFNQINSDPRSYVKTFESMTSIE